MPDDEEQVNHTLVEFCDEQSRVQTQARMDGHSVHAPGERLQGTCQLRKNERSNRGSNQTRLKTVLIREQGRKLEKITDVATTLMARDYKGFGNQVTNGVIEWK